MWVGSEFGDNGYMHSKITVTETNSGNDSKGEAFGLSGNQYLYIVISLVVSTCLILLLHLFFKCNLGIAGCFAIWPFLLTAAYIIGLKHNKPEGYDRDYVENVLYGADWAPSLYLVKEKNSDDLF